MWLGKENMHVVTQYRYDESDTTATVFEIDRKQCRQNHLSIWFALFEATNLKPTVFALNAIRTWLKSNLKTKCALSVGVFSNKFSNSN